MRAAVFFAFALLLACARTALAADFAVPPVPNHFVTDGAGALSEATRTALETELHAYETSTRHQVIVWIGKTTGEVPLETWAAETAHTWRVGRRGYDDGAVLFIFMDDHKVRIEVGYGLEGSLTDADSKRIIDERIVPAMRQHDTDRAVSDGVRAILMTITPAYAGGTIPAASPESSAASSNAGTLLLLILAFAVPIGLVILMFAFAARRRGTSGGSSGGFSGGSSGETFSSSSDDFSSSSDDDFDAGGGDFGGGGASGSW